MAEGQASTGPPSSDNGMADDSDEVPQASWAETETEELSIILVHMIALCCHSG